ncbi:glycosyl-4,4'-diaponeurosporenoate acyltransferase [Peribacillus cavernae]|uniref:Glycosyl-4,4'-diaponeurosporenoate acyltransferase n=1 Tax=Peribacillus cavernae TaxID=1674310 RepID=A0A3S0TY54_9BACI|nr:glycosyl-4,4'-diaponeurosporenoate acyltransferase [Peribacillus cavernae]MDQ0220600.1 glycosyl-4,4'-diaponeurosporenoate acyltransferase [Peribacillus cavernae]RUQ27341.1 glycosyl-4,4'-diaponeurosporenoate acyltransferase [Peribacillus cavernae]
MPIISLPVIWIILIDIIAWTFFHLLISVICLKLSSTFFLRESYWFKIFWWEKSGKLWQKLFRVKRWKGLILDGTIFLKKGYDKKGLHGTKISDLKTFAAETKRAELTHWLSILPAPLFFLWNPLWAGWAMILYALLFNLPIIVVQRYNRGRITTITSPNK